GVPLYQAAREIVETEELPGRTRKSLADLIASFERWRRAVDGMKHTELGELILDESGYTSMWQQDKSPQAHSRLENLKELIRFMHEFDSLQGCLELDVVFLPGWEEGLFPHQRSLDENGTNGLEEERRLAYVGLTRARRKAKVSFVQNRRTRGLWQASTPSRFVNELPEKHLDIVAMRSPHAGPASAYGNPYGHSRFEEPGAGFSSGYGTPGWQRAKQQWGQDNRRRSPGPQTIEAKLVASSTGRGAGFARGERVFHEK